MTQAYSDVHCYSSAPQSSCLYTPAHLACAIVWSQAGREIGPMCHPSAAAEYMGYLVLTILRGTKQRLAIVADGGGRKSIRYRAITMTV